MKARTTFSKPKTQNNQITINRISELEQENQNLKNQLKRYQATECKNNPDENQKKILVLSAQISSYEAELAQRDIKIDELKQALNSRNDSMKDILPKVQKLQNIVKQQKNTISLLNSENQTLKAENTSFRTRSETSLTISHDVDVSDSVNDTTLKTKLAKLRDALARRNTEYKILNTKVENLQKQNKQLFEIIRLQNLRLKHTTSSQHNARKPNSPLSSKLKQTSNDDFSNFDSMLKEINGKDAYLNEMVLELIECQAKDKVLQENGYLKAKNDAIAIQSKQISELQKELSDKIDEIDELKKQLCHYEELETELESIKLETALFKESLMKLMTQSP